MVRFVDDKIWQACAGPSIEIPTVNSTVYYFPQGHMDEAIHSPLIISASRTLITRPYILCTVSTVQLLADPNTDEVFANLILQPLVSPSPTATPGLSRFSNNNNDSFVSFAKILTFSDVTPGGTFYFPRSCAEPFFQTNYLEAGKKVVAQQLKVSDVHGNAWEFRYHQCGRTKRHWLTKGWRNFAENKRLVIGDSVVFMVNYSTGEIFIGIRRAASQFTLYSSQISCYHENPSPNGKLSPVTVAEAAELAASNKKFEVAYYPKAGTGWSDFVVKAEVVEKALNAVYLPGMRVKMAVQTDYTSTTPELTWFQGVISSLVINGILLWQGSPWRMLRIKWDEVLEVEPEVLKNSKWVSPWQVEVVAPSALPVKEIGKPLDDSFTGMKLRDRLDAHCQSGKILVEEFSLEK